MGFLEYLTQLLSWSDLRQLVFIHQIDFVKSSRQAVFCKIAVPKNIVNLTGKDLYLSLFRTKVLQKFFFFMKKRHWHRCYPMRFYNFLRTPLIQYISKRMLLFYILLCICSKALNHKTLTGTPNVTPQNLQKHKYWVYFMA